MIIHHIPSSPDALFSLACDTQTASGSPFSFLPIHAQHPDPSLCFLPSHLRTRLTLPLYKGWRATFSLVHSFLRHTFFQDAPTVSNLREYLKSQLKARNSQLNVRSNPKTHIAALHSSEELEPARFDISNGGLLDFALDYIFQLSSMSTYILNTTHPSLVPFHLSDRISNNIRLFSLILSIEISETSSGGGNAELLGSENVESLGIGRKLKKYAMNDEHEMVRDRCCPGYGKEMLKWGSHEVGVEERAMFRLEKFSDDSRGDPGSSLDIGDH